MKYTININQLALQKIDKKLDLKDAAILEYLKAFCATDDKKVDQMDFKEDDITYRYTFIDYSWLVQEMPILQFKQTRSITDKFKKLKNAGLIKTRLIKSERTGRNKTYVRLTEKVKETEFLVIEKNEPKNLDYQGAKNLNSLAKESRFLKQVNNKTISSLNKDSRDSNTSGNNNIEEDNNLLNTENSENTTPETEEEKESTQKRATSTREFFANKDDRQTQIERLIGIHKDETFVKEQLEKFIEYWTDENSSGKKRWQLQNKFDVVMRLSTWFRNAKNWTNNNKFNSKATII